MTEQGSDWVVQAERPGPEEPDGGLPELHEREQATRVAQQAVDTLCREFAAGGVELGSLLLYSGEAGLGKTSMLQRVRTLAGRRGGCTVLSARGGEQRVKEPFHVLTQLLQPTLLALTPAQRKEVFGHWIDIAGPAVGMAKPTAAEPDPQSVRAGLDYVVTQLARLKAPLVMLVDDLQWADAESFAWLESFAVRSPELPVLLVIAWRSGQLPEDAQAFRTLVASNPHRHLEFKGLTPASVEKLVHAAYPDTAEDYFCRQVWAVTAGSPYLVNALLAKVRERGIEPVEENVPLLHDLAAEANGMTRELWLAKLGVSTLTFAHAASILGTQILPNVAARIAGQTPAVASEAISELRRHQVLTGPADGPLEFVHPLVATSIYRSSWQSTRTAMHGKAAVEVELAGRPLTEATRHLLETHGEGDPEVVAKLRRAARDHLAVGAPAAAKRCLERALEEPPEDEDRAAVIYELGCSALLTDPVTTVRQLRIALETDGLSDELRVDATFRLSEVLAHSGQLVEAARLTLDAAEHTPPGDGRLRLEVAHYIWAAFQREEEDGPGRSARLGRLSAELTGDDVNARAARALRAWDLTLQGQSSTEALELVDSALLDGRLPPGLAWTNSNWGLELPGIIGLTYVYTDRLDRAERLFEDAIRSFEVAGWGGGHLGFAHFLMGLARFRRGALAEAEEFLRSALRIARRLGSDLPLQWDAVGVLADTLLARGRTEEACKLAADYGFAPPYHPTAMVLPDAPTLYGKLLLAQGDRVAAAGVLRGVGAQLTGRGWRNTIWAPWVGHLAVAVHPVDPVEARELAEQGLADAQRFGTASAIGTALRMSAAVTEGQRAVEFLEEAVRQLGRSPVGYEHAYALVELGAALRRVGRLGDATEHLHQGMELAVECNADGLVARAREELKASGLRPNRLRTTSKDALSQGEWEVAEFVVGGLSALEIAERLDLPLSLVNRRLAAVHRKTGTNHEGLAAALGLKKNRPDDTAR
ncbi:tetratricopeptide (TPR) repeat protein [Kitasatospora sp. MAA4]|uniref:helix-turn-helix transcriptional regulator n=1 Tax=Kitasatospora sp. MAA4 TaxID=3035093 RepID=UPI0024771A9D|nr:AAA family ATPase [Kitasatospora sp. MAA4]MDH6136161.1 tetratricopeptide (TPR) repeat protein [Kitasatospora sp. MAA4]